MPLGERHFMVHMKMHAIFRFGVRCSPNKCSPPNAPHKMLSKKCSPKQNAPLKMLPKTKCSSEKNAPRQNALHQNAPRKKMLPEKNAPQEKMLPIKMLPEKKCSPQKNAPLQNAP